MPTSDHHNINTTLTILLNLQPKSVLDIGCGFGKYGVLLREYCDVWNQRLEATEWKLEMVGIEAFPRYRNPLHDFAYSKVYYGEAQQVLPELGQFDAVLIADVIEHLEKPLARQIVRDCFEHSPVVLITTPKEFYAQQAVFENPYEIHRHLWTENDYPPDVTVRKISLVSCNAFVASSRRLPDSVFSLADPVDMVYLRSRMKLGKYGWPVSVSLRWLCRQLS